MIARTSSFGWTSTITAFSVISYCGAAMAQGAAPPPAVSVTPAATRQVTETGDLVGRVALGRGLLDCLIEFPVGAVPEILAHLEWIGFVRPNSTRTPAQRCGAIPLSKGRNTESLNREYPSE
jgi:hypothetical protein